jgi:hypothetical protein
VGEQIRSQIHELVGPAAHASNLQPSTSNTHKRTPPQSITHEFPVGRTKTASLLKKSLTRLRATVVSIHLGLSLLPASKNDRRIRGVARLPTEKEHHGTSHELKNNPSPPALEKRSRRRRPEVSSCSGCTQEEGNPRSVCEIESGTIGLSRINGG